MELFRLSTVLFERCIGQTSRQSLFSLELVWDDALGDVAESAEEAGDTVAAALLWVELGRGLVALGGGGAVVLACLHGLAELDEAFDNVATVLNAFLATL